MRIIKITGLLILLFLSGSCTQKSLQKYLVEKQDDDHFMKFDIPGSMLRDDNMEYSAEEQEAVQSIRKINIVAFPLKNDTIAYQTEKQELTSILNQNRYKELTHFTSNSFHATLKYTGDEDAIEEIIVFISEDSKGFAVLRLLGKNLKPQHLHTLIQNQGKWDFTGFPGLEFFKE